jgi:inosose dehydratase
MNLTIGIAPDSWGVWFANDPHQPTWQQCVDEMVASGYDTIEIGPYGYMPTDPNRLNAELAQRGLTAVANAVVGNLENEAAWPALELEMTASGELLAALDAPYIILIDDAYSDLSTGRLREPRELDQAGWRRLINTTHRVADLMRTRFGLKLLFHPHAETHVQSEDQIERFLADTDPARVGLCLDTGHHAYCGGDAVAFMRRHYLRIPHLHLKSVDGAMLRRVKDEGIPYGVAVPQDLFCEPSRGIVDFVDLRDLLREIDYTGYGIVEQDMYPAPLDKPLPIAQRTRAYLREIGMG